MKITKRQLRRIIREAIDPEYMREEILGLAETIDVDGMTIIMDLMLIPENLWPSDESGLDLGFDAIEAELADMSPEDVALVHKEITNEGLFG
tara:strand:+ start:267 stop:542 length:276 start_codon:yes stop_codon:yes gene_type:complete